jgi:hypothetical protein
MLDGRTWTHPSEVAELFHVGGWTSEAVAEAFAGPLKGEFQEYLPTPVDIGGRPGPPTTPAGA